MTEAVLFWIFAGLTLAGGAAVVLAKNPVNAAMSLVGSFFSLAGLYLLLSAQLLAALQILVYAGAIMVLFLFVIMLLNLSPAELAGERYGFSHIMGAGAALAATILLGTLVSRLVFPATGAAAELGTVAAVGRALFVDYTLPFETVSLLLLSAILGAVVVAKARL